MKSEQPPRPMLEPERRELIQTGYSYFLAIADAYPGTEVAQGIALARLCKEPPRHDPYDVMAALSGDADKMGKLVRVANVKHRMHGVEIEPMTHERVKGVLLNEGRIAEEAMVLDTEELDEILSRYPDAVASYLGRMRFNEHVRVTIAKKKFNTYLERTQTG